VEAPHIKTMSFWPQEGVQGGGLGFLPGAQRMFGKWGKRGEGPAGRGRPRLSGALCAGWGGPMSVPGSGERENKAPLGSLQKSLLFAFFFRLSPGWGLLRGGGDANFFSYGGGLFFRAGQTRGKNRGGKKHSPNARRGRSPKRPQNPGPASSRKLARCGPGDQKTGETTGVGSGGACRGGRGRGGLKKSFGGPGGPLVSPRRENHGATES